MISVRSEVQILPGPPSSCVPRHLAGSSSLLGSQGRPAAAPNGASLYPKRGHSSVGRAVALQASGRRFDPVWLHQIRKVFKFRLSSETMVGAAVCHCEEGIYSRAAHPAACECPTPSASLNRVYSASINGLSDHMSLRVDLADIDHENDQVP